MSVERGDGDARARIELDVDASLVVVAGAGTGKTTALVGRIVELVRTGRASLREIAAITFSEAAAAELRRRIQDAVDTEAAASPHHARLAAARHEVDEAAICTLHAFARRMLVEHCVDGGIPPGFDVMDETASRADFDTRFARFADALLADPGAEPALVRGFSVGLVPEDLADMAWALHLHWDRLEDGGLDALERARPEPGHWPRADAAPVLGALDAALALAGRCTDDGDKLKEHLDAMVVVRAQLASCDDEQSTLQLLDGLKGLQCTYGQQRNWGGAEGVDEVRGACARAEAARQDLLRATRHAVVGELGARLAAFVMTAANERRAEGRLSLHDLLVHARRLLRHDGAAARALRGRYRRLLVDEFQDADPIQVELAARLAATVDGSADLHHAEPGGLFVVGDPKQSIYRFRRADIESFARVGRRIGEHIVLATNFRSVPGILEFVNTVFADLFGAEPVPGQAAHAELVAERGPLPLRWAEGGRTGARPPSRGGAPAITVGVPGSTAVQLSLEGIAVAAAPAPGGREPGGDLSGSRAAPGMPPVVVLGGPGRGTPDGVRRAVGRDVAGAVAAVVGTHWAVADPDTGRTRAARWRDVAVLLPARAALPAIEEALEDARIPYRLEGPSMLWGSDEVRDVLAVLHAADDPADAVAVLGALRSPGLACGDDDLVRWRQAGGTWDPAAPPPAGLGAHPVGRALAVLAGLHRQRWWSEPSAMVTRTFEALDSFAVCLAHHRPRDHWHRLRWLQDQARLFDETVGGPLRSFLRWADLQAEDDRSGVGVGPPDPDDDAVRVMTIRGSKGLEFPVVVLAGLEREAGVAQRASAVLWREDGTPLLRARGDLKSHGYDEADERERELDALEQHRLLYVGMTRARDHLVLCLHHKEPRQGSTAAPTEAARLLAVCERHPRLWRRLPADEATAPDDPPRRVAAEAGEDDARAWRARAEQFAARRGALLAAGRHAPVTSATAVAERVATAPGAGNGATADGDGRHAGAYRGPGGGSPHAGSPHAGSPHTGSPDAGSPDATGALWRHAEVSLQIGRAVHSALAAIDLSTGTDASGRAAPEVARLRATSHGVGAHHEAIATMVGAALSSPTVVAGAGRRHWRELFVAAPVGDGAVLEGFVDLVVEDGPGLVVVDYRTDRTGGPSGLAAAAARYRPQLACYALAVAQATGRPVARGVLVFLGDGRPVEHVLDGADLEAARTLAERAAGELVGSR